MPAPKELPTEVFKDASKRWIRLCPICTVRISHLRRNYCINAHVIKQPCKRCSNISNHPSGMVGAVRLSWFASFHNSALTRGYSWELTPEDIAELHTAQRGICAFSGAPIGWSIQGCKHTASIDRIDNARGYSKDNILLVHKDVNMLRGSLPVVLFLEWCSRVTRHQNNNNKRIIAYVDSN